ncbi:MAG TPA: MraY family glycosyltransferase [Candidatus Dormibacteraeota bacterium]|nr:MraY family glycosyltransferase [Candidatus Dormibacteraeota bacterium]
MTPVLGISAAWTPAVLPFWVASFATMAAVPVTMAAARRFGAVADASRERDVHEHPTPRFGGLAMMAAFAFAMAVFGGSVDHRWAIIAVVAGVSLVMAVDDALDLSPGSKLLVDLASGVAVAAIGITIDFIALPGGHVLQFGILAAPITVAWVVGMENSVNLIDGVDGVAAGVCAIVAGVLLLAAVNRLGAGGGAEQGVIVMAGALIGCCVGFLVFNFHPARTFMGDSGSRFLGLTLAVMSIQGVAKIAAALALAVPLLALALPIGDTAFAIYRRRRLGLAITTADTGHLHHRLLDYGLSVRETAFAFWIVTAILGCFALALFGHQHILAVGAVLLAASLIGLVVRNRRRMPVVERTGRVVLPRSAVVPTRAGQPADLD